jgi:hypothetical protein
MALDACPYGQKLKVKNKERVTGCLATGQSRSMEGVDLLE